MGEQRGYTCDREHCDHTTVVDAMTALPTQAGWFMVLTPHGWPTLHYCSSECLVDGIPVQRDRMRQLGRPA